LRDHARSPRASARPAATPDVVTLCFRLVSKRVKQVSGPIDVPSRIVAEPTYCSFYPVSDDAPSVSDIGEVNRYHCRPLSARGIVGAPVAGADRPAHDCPQTEPAPAGFLDSWRPVATRNRGLIVWAHPLRDHVYCLKAVADPKTQRRLFHGGEDQ
jgi:hypothetical protein